MSNFQSVRLDADIGQRLDNLSNRTGRPKTYYIREALREYLDDMEDLYLIEQRMLQAHKNDEKNFSLREIAREYGLED